MPVVGFSARKQALTLYSLNLAQNEQTLLKLGKYTTGKGCLYIKSLADVDLEVLEDLITAAYAGRS
jgi:hypothetical protein